MGLHMKVEHMYKFHQFDNSAFGEKSPGSWRSQGDRFFKKRLDYTIPHRVISSHLPRFYPFDCAGISRAARV